MTVKITLEFPSVEEAIVALGKMSALGKARRAANQTIGAQAVAAPVATAKASEAPPSSPPAAPVTPVVTGTPRKPRADKGKPRGPYKPDTNAEGAGAQSENAASPAAPAAAPSAEVSEQNAVPVSAPEGAAGSPQGPVTGAAPVPSTDEAIKAGEDMLAAKGLEAVRALITSYGVARISAIPADKRAEFIAKARAK